MTRRRYLAGLCLGTLAAAGALPAAARDRAAPGWRIVKIAGRPERGAWTRYHVPVVPGGFTQLNSMTLIPGTHSIWAVGTSLARSATKSFAVLLKYGS
jgi:hypothetical protein